MYYLSVVESTTSQRDASTKPRQAHDNWSAIVSGKDRKDG